MWRPIRLQRHSFLRVSILVVFGFALDAECPAWADGRRLRVSILVVFGFALDDDKRYKDALKDAQVSILVVFGFALDARTPTTRLKTTRCFNPCCIWICA